MLEMLVQDEPLRARYVMIEVRIPSGVTIDRIGVDDLPSNWRDIAVRERLQAAAVLAVPSAVIAAETNYLLNPLHPDFHRIKIGKPRKFEKWGQTTFS